MIQLPLLARFNRSRVVLAALFALALNLSACGSAEGELEESAAAVWPVLRHQLAQVLEETGAFKRSSQVPQGESGRVTDLVLNVLPPEGSQPPVLELSWSYRSTGDYDQNGTVAAADLTPIGLNFLASAADLDWPAARVADGNADGLVNAADLTPIGLNFSNEIDGYLLEAHLGEASAEPAADSSGWSAVSGQDLPLSAGEKPETGGFLRFGLSGPLGAGQTFAYSTWYRVRPYRDSNEGRIAGSPSVARFLADTLNEAPVAELQADVDMAVAGTLVTWDASGSSDDGSGAWPGPGAIAKYEWDFDADGIYEYESRQTAPAENIDPDGDGPLPEMPVDQLPGYRASDNSLPRAQADFYYYASRQHSVSVKVSDVAGLSSEASLSQSVLVDESFETSVVDEDGAVADLSDSLGLAESSGRPCITYRNDDGNSGGTDPFSFIVAEDPLGSQWSSPVEVTLPGDQMQIHQLDIWDGKPAVSLYIKHELGDPPSQGLWVIRAEDSQGLTWNAPQKLGEPGTSSVTFLNTARTDDGRVVLALADSAQFGNSIAFLTSSSASGAGWGPAREFGNYGKPSAFSWVAGNPALVSFNTDEGDLYFQRAKDASGNQWPLPSVVDYVGDVGYRAQLGEAGGRPLIVYYDNTFRTLKLIRAADATGSDWEDPLFLDSQLSSSLTSLSKIPFILGQEGDRLLLLYTGQSESGLELRLLTANDSAAQSWGFVTSLGPYSVPIALASRFIGGRPCLAKIENLPSIEEDSTADLTFGTIR
jgi:hypothetical protein